MTVLTQFDWSLTEEKIAELVRRIVKAADPIEVIAFGSRARGDHREDSDLDLAVIVEDEAKAREDLRDVTDGIDCSVDLLKIGKARYDEFRPWINTVAQQIDREGIRLYERGKKPQLTLLWNASARDERSLAFALDDEVFGYHVQQAVEKLLKALITAHGERHKFTHDVQDLVDDLAKLGEALPAFPMSWDDLTEYALESRYEVGVHLPEQMRNALRSAVADLRMFIEKRMKELAAAGTQVINP